MKRRELIASAMAAGGAAWLVASADGIAEAEAQDDVSVMRSALALELLVAFVYRHLLAAGVLGPTAAALVRDIRQHEQVHVNTLTAELARRGQAPPAPPTSVREADRRLSARNASGRLAAVRTELDGLRLLYDVESISIGGYHEALLTLSDQALVRLAAEIMGAEAQHAGALGGLLHPGKWERVVPVASVEGKHQ